jgi:hypothetical protein
MIGKFGRVSIDQEAVKGAVAMCWKELGILYTIILKTHTAKPAKSTRNTIT